MNKLLSSLVLILFSALALIFGFDLEQAPEDVEAKDRVVVTGIIDGDTVDVLIGSKTERVRLIGIDTPEVGQCYFKESKAYLEEILEHKEVIIESDSSQDNRDRYDRLLRYIYFPDGTNIGEELVRLGYANEYTYRKAYEYQQEFKDAESFAQANQLGLHKVCNQN